MLSNKEVIKKFIKGESAKNVNLRSTGDRLINYYTTIAERMNNGTIILNSTRYSSSTSKIQSYARYEIGVYKEVFGVPMGTYNLSKYIR